MSYMRRTLVLLLLVLVADYADRTLIGALGPTLERTFDFDNAQLGLLGAAFGIVGAIATVPIGVLADRMSRTALLAVSLALWAAALVVTGAALSFIMLFAARLLLGAVAATTGPTLPSLIGDLVDAGGRARAIGFVNSGQLIGSGAGLLLAALVTQFFSFRWCFWLLALAGVALAMALWRLREPERSDAAGPTSDRTKEKGGGRARRETRVQGLVREKGIEPSRRAVLSQDPSAMSLWQAARYVMRVRTDVIVLLARAVGDYFLSAVGIFGVIFATRQYHLTQRNADLAILGVGVGALAGVLLAGWVADLLLRRGYLSSRIWLGALGHLLAPLPLLPAFLTHSVAVALPLFALGAFLLAGTQPSLDAVRVDVIVPRLRGRAESIRQVLRTLAEGGAPLIFGLLAGSLAGGGPVGLQVAFLITLPVLLANGLILLIALRTYASDVAAALASDAPQ